MTKTLYYLLRPLAAAPFAYAFALGALNAGLTRPVPTLGYLLALVFGFAGGAHIVNSWADRLLDQKSPVIKDIPLNQQPFATGRVTTAAGWSLAIFCFASAALVFSTLGQGALFLILALIILAVGYSVWPRLKARMPWDTIINSLSAGAVVFLGFWVNDPARNPNIFLVGSIIFLVAATYLLTLIIDLAEDREAGLATTAVTLGIKKSARLSALIYGLALIFYFLYLAAGPLRWWQGLLLLALLRGGWSFVKLWRDPSKARANRLMYRAAKAAAGTVAVLALYSLLCLGGAPDFLLWPIFQ